MEPKNRNEMAHTSFFFSFATMPADLPFSFTKAAGARSIIAVPAFHFSLVLLALVSALISASDAVSSKAASSFLIRLGWFCNPQWLVMAPALLSLRCASFFVAPSPPAPFKIWPTMRSAIVGAMITFSSAVIATPRNFGGSSWEEWSLRNSHMCSNRAVLL